MEKIINQDKMALFARCQLARFSSCIFSRNGRTLLENGKVTPKLKLLFCSGNQEVCNGLNIYKDGQDPPIKPDSEYPEWLWSLRLEKVSLDELSVDDKGYWRRMKKAEIKQQNALRKQGKLK